MESEARTDAIYNAQSRMDMLEAGYNSMRWESWDTRSFIMSVLAPAWQMVYWLRVSVCLLVQIIIILIIKTVILELFHGYISVL